MSDDFEVYAEDNFAKYMEQAERKAQSSSKWVTFDEESSSNVELTVEYEKDGVVENITTLTYPSHTEGVKKNTNFMLISHKKSGDSDELKSILRGLHENKLENTTIILQTTYGSLNEEELDLLEVFTEQYKNFHIEYTDKEHDDEIFNKPTYYDSDEESDVSVHNSDDEDKDKGDNDEGPFPESFPMDFAAIMKMRDVVKNLKWDDPSGLDIAGKLVLEITKTYDQP